MTTELLQQGRTTGSQGQVTKGSKRAWKGNVMAVRGQIQRATKRGMERQ